MIITTVCWCNQWCMSHVFMLAWVRHDQRYTWPCTVAALTCAPSRYILHGERFSFTDVFLVPRPGFVFLKDCITCNAHTSHFQVVKSRRLGPWFISDEDHGSASILKLAKLLVTLFNVCHRPKSMEEVYNRFALCHTSCGVLPSTLCVDGRFKMNAAMVTASPPRQPGTDMPLSCF
jgi:hypothetical protein